MQKAAESDRAENERLTRPAEGENFADPEGQPWLNDSFYPGDGLTLTLNLQRPPMDPSP